jgi:4-phospho-D-threonate 3-dehydrogenase / 4-phospho-D-erythronate 3-dehydrogenase
LLPLVSISLGDPAGIGPEVVIKALADASLRSPARWVICGNWHAIAPVAERLSVRLRRILLTQSLSTSLAHVPPTADGEIILLEEPTFEHITDFQPNSARCGAASLAYVERAIALAQDEKLPAAWRANAIATAPISKEAWHLAGETRYPGHTELFAERFAADNYAMMFAAEPRTINPHENAPGLHCILATAHMPLRDVATTLTTQRILDTITLGHQAMQRLGYARPRIGVCGLNPHAGEHGILGHEDDDIITPAITAARTAGMHVIGPLPGDTIFQGALAYASTPPRDFDLVVAMYHDQGLIPLKLVAFDRAVNMTVGLMHDGKPILRTSPDHGTAFNIAGKFAANPGSMAAALRMAVQSAAATHS